MKESKDEEILRKKKWVNLKKERKIVEILRKEKERVMKS